MLVSVITALIIPMASLAQADPLPSWNDAGSKKALVDFVQRVTRQGGPGFVAPIDRVAVFDNDGTLWAEQPMYFQIMYAFDRVKALAPQHPEWNQLEPFASILKGDTEGALAGGKHTLLELFMATHGNVTADEFQRSVQAWLDSARHPQTNRRYNEMVYQPMLEVLVYLRANGFKTYIVSGGGIDFIRVFAESTYGIPRDQVIGSSVKATYELREGRPAIVKLPEVDFIDDKAGKPVAIHQHIGRRPIAAFGNSDGDFEMLEWTTSGPGPSLGLIVHHDDSAREWVYDRDSKIGHLDHGLTEAAARKWVVVSMKQEWRLVYPPTSGGK